jgi:hypothetical protein
MLNINSYLGSFHKKNDDGKTLAVLIGHGHHCHALFVKPKTNQKSCHSFGHSLAEPEFNQWSPKLTWLPV